MGCGASTAAKGREVPTSRATDNFFPPDDEGSNKQGTTTKSTTGLSNHGNHRTVSKATTASGTNTPNSLSPNTKKKKAAYVPPAPITAPVGKTSKPSKGPSPPLDESSATLPTSNTKSQTTKAKYQPPAVFAPADEDSLDLLPPAEEKEDQEDDFGELVLPNDEFDATVISAMTNDHEVRSTRPQQPQQFSSTRTLEAPQPSSKSGMRFDELYRLKGVLGTGAFSTVREGFHRSNTDHSYAVKCINRKKLSEEDEAALLDEVAILKELKHVHIIRLFDFFTEPSTYYLVMERMRGGELFDRIVAKAYYNEKEARDTCKIVLEAVGYCHSNHVAHRDLKPENLLLLSEDDDSAVKIADFGFAKRVVEPNSLTTQCGTPGYVAPEILEGTPYDERADMWSVGVILYILLGGYPPFIESTQRDLFRKIRKGDYEFHEEYWGTVSAEAKNLIQSLLTVDSSVRLTATQALANEWILGDDADLANRELGANLDKLRNFNAKRKFRAAVSTVMAANKLNSLGAAFFSKPFAKEESS